MKKYLFIIPFLMVIIACDSDDVETNSQPSASINPLIGEWDVVKAETTGWTQQVYNFNTNDVVYNFINDSIVSVVVNNPNVIANAPYEPISTGLSKYHTKIVLPGVNNQDTLRFINSRAWANSDYTYETYLFGYFIEAIQNDTILTITNRSLLINDNLSGTPHYYYMTLEKR